MPILYHYSKILHLPPILAEGLCRGEVAHPDRRAGQVAVSLTTQTDPTRLACWANKTPILERTAVRFTCRIPEDDPKLEPARGVWKRNGLTSQHVKQLDPLGQSKWWFFYHGTIPATWFDVELWGADGYVRVAGRSLEQTRDAVQSLRDRFNFIVPEGMPWALAVVPKNEGDASNDWIIHEGFPADVPWLRAE